MAVSGVGNNGANVNRTNEVSQNGRNNNLVQRNIAANTKVSNDGLNQVTNQVSASQATSNGGNPIVNANPDLQNTLNDKRVNARINADAGAKPPEATVTNNGNNVIIDTGDGDDNVGITQDPKNGSVTVSVNGENHTFTGAQANNITIRAGNGNDVITVGSGVTVNLRLEGGDGDDRITGGAGDDTIEGGKGNDILNGGAGRDYINGSLGDDTISGGTGNDVIYGGNGNDLLRGQDGHDYVEGGRGDDRVYGNSGNDIVSGGIGDDSIYGGAGNDRLYAGQGNDHLYNRGGNDTIYAQTANDTIAAAPKGSNNVVVNVELTGSPGSQSVRVEGTPEFVERVEADLEFLRSSPTGRQMLGAFDQAYQDSRDARADWGFPFNIGANDGNTVVIREGGNTANITPGSNSADVWGNPATGERGRGADAVINYNVSGTTLYGNNPTDPTDDWNDTPPSVILYHEMAHNYNYVTGSLAPGDYNGAEPIDHGQGNRERQAVGLPIDHDNDPSTPEQTVVGHPHELTENGLRDELGIPRRPTYAN